MEFQDFWKEKERMCKQQGPCCPISGENCPIAKLGSINRLSCSEVIVRNCDKLHEIFGNNFKMTYHDVRIVYISCNGETTPMSEWMNQEYKEPENRENEES